MNLEISDFLFLQHVHCYFEIVYQKIFIDVMRIWNSWYMKIFFSQNINSLLHFSLLDEQLRRNVFQRSVVESRFLVNDNQQTRRVLFVYDFFSHGYSPVYRSQTFDKLLYARHVPNSNKLPAYWEDAAMGVGDGYLETFVCVACE